jgi:hypothetical protein
MAKGASIDFTAEDESPTALLPPMVGRVGSFMSTMVNHKHSG